MRIEQLIKKKKKLPPLTPVVISEPIFDDCGDLIEVAEHDVLGVSLRAGRSCTVAEIELFFSKTWLNKLTSTAKTEAAP